MAAPAKIVVIGIDGATWEVIRPLMHAGKMPNLQRLVSMGASGTLHSFEYSASPLAWTTIATGKLPAKHNIRDFRVSRHDLRARQVWDIAASHGRKVGIFQYLVTWPPQPLDGFIVPGWLAPDPAAYPAELNFINEFVNRGRFVRRDEANRAGDYLRFAARVLRSGLSTSTVGKIVRFGIGRVLRRLTALDARYRMRSIWVSLSTDLFRHLLRKYQPDFAAIVFYQTDSIGHYFWKFRQPERFQDISAADAARYGSIIDRIYCDADTAIGRILRTVGDDCHVVVLSDHGMGPALHESGRLYRPRVEQLLENLGVEWRGGRHAVIGLDFHILVNDERPQSWESDFAEFKKFIEGIRISETGEQVFEARLLQEGPASVRVTAARPELIGKTVLLPNGKQTVYENLVNTDEELSGAHHPEGVLVMAGPAIKQGCELVGAHLADVAPTLLTLMGLPVGRDMDGRVLEEAFDEHFLSNQPIAYIDSHEEKTPPGIDGQSGGLSAEERKIVEERLRALGYLS